MQENKYIAIKEIHQEIGYPIVLLCDVADVNRAAYYKWLNRKETNLEKENKILIGEIIKLYEEVNGIYGYRRITLNINKRLKKSFNHKRIYRLISTYENNRIKICNS